MLDLVRTSLRDTQHEHTALAKTSQSLGGEQPCEHIPYDVLSEMFKVVLAASVAVWVGCEYLYDYYRARSNQDHFSEVIILSSHKSLLTTIYNASTNVHSLSLYKEPRHTDDPLS